MIAFSHQFEPVRGAAYLKDLGKGLAAAMGEIEQAKPGLTFHNPAFGAFAEEREQTGSDDFEAWKQKHGHLYRWCPDCKCGTPKTNTAYGCQVCLTPLSNWA